MPRRILFLLVLLGLCSGWAAAHGFPVRVEASFPTASRSGIKLTMTNPDTGQLVTGAALDMQVQGLGFNRTIRLKEAQEGVYESADRFDPGEYTFTFFDRTLPGEPLQFKQTGVTLPRLVNQDLLVWNWPPSAALTSQPPLLPNAPGGGPNSLLLVLILAPVGLAVVGGLAVVVLAGRSRRAKNLEP